MPADAAVAVEWQWGAPNQDAAQRVELVDAVPEQLDVAAFPHHVPLERRNLVGPGLDVAEIRLDAEVNRFDPVLVVAHLVPRASLFSRAIFDHYYTSGILRKGLPSLPKGLTVCVAEASLLGFRRLASLRDPDSFLGQGYVGLVAKFVN
ncbi:hypothetical protein BC2230_40871 [Burkholderia cepacia]